MPYYEGSNAAYGSGYQTTVSGSVGNDAYGGNSIGVFDALGRAANDLTGATASNQATARENNLNRQFSSAEAQRTRDWEEYMSNTAYQRQVEDMKKAGINPAMAANGGGASTPSGATAGQPASAHMAKSGSSPISQIAATVLSAILFKKFGAAASTAKTAAGATKAVASEANSAKAAVAASKEIKNAINSEPVVTNQQVDRALFDLYKDDRGMVDGMHFPAWSLKQAYSRARKK